MKKYLIIPTLLLLTFIVSCNQNELLSFDNQSTENTSIFYQEVKQNFPVDKNLSSIYEVKVYVTTLSDVDRTYNITVDPISTAVSEHYSLPTSSVTIPANSYEGIYIVNGTDDEDLDTGGEILILHLDSGSDNILDGKDTLQLTLYEACPENDSLKLIINFDGYANEESWDIRDSDNLIIMSGGGYDQGFSYLEQEICLVDGTYTFTIHDSYGDGLYDGVTTGTYELSKGDIIYASGSGNYGFEESTTFTK
jgi:hypothetical protein